MKYLIAAAAALIAGSPSVAAAEDNFTGPSISIGPAFVQSDVATELGGVVDASTDLEATAVALRIGYDHEFTNNVVIGASWWNIVDSMEEESDQAISEVDFSEIAARVGYAAGPWLPFVAVGYMNRDVTLSFECPPAATTCVPGDPTEADFDDSTVSYRVGLERRLGTAFVSASYTWADFDAEEAGAGIVEESDVQAALIEVGLRF